MGPAGSVSWSPAGLSLLNPIRSLWLQARGRLSLSDGAYLAAVELLFPLCRSALGGSRDDVVALRQRIHAMTSDPKDRTAWSTRDTPWERGSVTPALSALNDLLSAPHWRGREPSAYCDVVLVTIEREAASFGVSLPPDRMAGPSVASQARNVFSDLYDYLSDGPRDGGDARAWGSRVGINAEREIHEARARRLGFPGWPALELRCAERLLPDFDRFARTEPAANPAVLRMAVRVGWQILAGERVAAQAEDLLAAVDGQAFDSTSFVSEIHSLGTRAASAVYSALEAVHGHDTEDNATGLARFQAEDRAALGRGLDTWAFGNHVVTGADAPVLDEIRNQLEDLAMLERGRTGDVIASWSHG